MLWFNLVKKKLKKKMNTFCKAKTIIINGMKIALQSQCDLTSHKVHSFHMRVEVSYKLQLNMKTKTKWYGLEFPLTSNLFYYFTDSMNTHVLITSSQVQCNYCKVELQKHCYRHWRPLLVCSLIINKSFLKHKPYLFNDNKVLKLIYVLCTFKTVL